jgi:hypothetical protein
MSPLLGKNPAHHRVLTLLNAILQIYATNTLGYLDE